MSDTRQLLEQAGVKVIDNADAKSTERGQVSFDSVDGWYPVFQYWQQGFVGERTPQRALELIRQYRSWTYACCNRNAIAVASVPLKLYYAKKSRGTRTLFPTRTVSKAMRRSMETRPHMAKALSQAIEVVEITEHPLLDLMRWVNEGWTWHDALELTSTYIDLCGMAFWALDLFKGQPRAFQVLPSQYTWPQWTREGQIVRYLFGFMPNQASFTTEEVIYFRQPSPIHQILGYGPGHAAYGGVMIQAAVEDYTDRTFKNNAVPAGLLSPEQPLTDDQAKRVVEDWNRKYAGAVNAGKVALAPFKVKFEAFTGDPRMIAKLAERAISKEEIAACYGVPLTKLDLSKADASAQQGDITYLRDTIFPRCQRIEDMLNGELTVLYDPDLFLAFDNPIPADRQYELSRAQSMAATSGIVYVNEVRQGFGLDPDPELDGVLLERAAPVLMPPDKKPPKDDDEPEADKDEATDDEGEEAKGIRTKAGGTQRFAKVLRGVFADQRKAVLARIVKSMRRGRTKSQDMFDLDEWIAKFMEASQPTLERSIAAGGAQGAEQLPGAIAFDVTSPQTQEFIHTYTYRFARSVNETTQQALRDVFSSGIAEGQTYQELADGVNAVFDTAERSRSLMIARTEGSRALNAGTTEAWRQSGSVTGMRWMADPNACEFCLALAAKYGPEGTPIALGGAFAAQGHRIHGVDGGVMTCDYGDVPHPPLHPNCICDLEPVLVGED